MPLEMRIPEGWDEPSPFKWGETAQRVAESNPLLALVWRARQAAYWMARLGWRDDLVLPDPNARPNEIGAWLLRAEDTAERLDALTSAISGAGFTWGALTVRCDRIARVLVLHHIETEDLVEAGAEQDLVTLESPGDDDGDGFAHDNGGRQEPDRHWEAR